MDDKYKKAIKAGLIGAVLIMVVCLIRDLIFYWSMTQPAVQKFVNQSAGSTPPVPMNFSNISPDVLLSGLAIIFGSLLIFVVYLLTGAIAAYYIAPSFRCTSLSNVVVQNVICGSIAGATAQAVSTPLTLLFLFLMDPPKTNTNILHWNWLSLANNAVYQHAGHRHHTGGHRSAGMRRYSQCFLQESGHRLIFFHNR